MRTALLSATGAFALAALAFSGSAQAQCWFDGWSSRCAAAPYYAVPYWGSPYAAWNSYDFRDYRFSPSWLPTYPGPRPGR